MKEYIFQPTIAQDCNAIVIDDAPTGLIKNNILAIINKSTKGIIHSPLVDGIANLAYSGTTLTINLNTGHPSIKGNLLIKAYMDEEYMYDKALAQFFGLRQAMPQFTYATDQEVIDIVDDVYNAYFPNN